MLRKWLWRMRGTKIRFPDPQPQKPLCVIGDVHGCLAELQALFGLIQAEASPDVTIVFVGDYIDRGPESAEVLRGLQQTPGLISLMGNHEEMLLSFLADPVSAGPAWLNHGGLQTLASFRLGAPEIRQEEQSLLDLRDRLQEAMGPELISWLRNLPLQYQSGNVMVCHAGADPNRVSGDQSRRTLLWGHPDMSRKMRQDGLWVVHGHTIVDRLEPTAGRICVDTGAYATGRLSAVLIDQGQLRFLST